MKSKTLKLKNKIKFVPEVYFLLSIVFYWYSTGLLLNVIAIGLMTILVYQLITRKKVTGMIISILFLLLSFFLILALFSELSEFNEFNDDAKTMALVGFSYLFLNLIFGSWMLISYQKTIVLKEQLNNSEL